MFLRFAYCVLFLAKTFITVCFQKLDLSCTFLLILSMLPSNNEREREKSKTKQNMETGERRKDIDIFTCLSSAWVWSWDFSASTFRSYKL